MPVIMMPGPQLDSTHGSAQPREDARPARRRGNARQGHALEMLGHAVEYLVDSRLFVLDVDAARSDAEAVQILMRSSRAVFAECPEVISLKRRLRLWVAGRLAQPLEISGGAR